MTPELKAALKAIKDGWDVPTLQGMSVYRIADALPEDLRAEFWRGHIEAMFSGPSNKYHDIAEDARRDDARERGER